MWESVFLQIPRPVFVVEFPCSSLPEPPIPSKSTGKKCGSGLIRAVKDGDLEELKKQVKSGRDVNCMVQEELTLLHVATLNANASLVMFIVDSGSEVDPKTGIGVTPLHMAVGIGDKVISEYLILKGANVNAKAKDGLTALSIALDWEWTELVELIKKHGGK